LYLSGDPEELHWEELWDIHGRRFVASWYHSVWSLAEPNQPARI
jgi:hypothetical protein